MRCMVTGCTGLLGSNLCYSWKDKNDVVGTSRGRFEMSGVKWLPCDLCDPSSLKRLFAEGPFDVVVHCAAMTDVDHCEEDPDFAMKVNRDAAVRLAEAAVSGGARFVFISTDAVFDGEKDGPYDEHDAVEPLNVYGESKALAEKRLLEMGSALVLRTNMHGFNYSDKSSLSEWVLDVLSRGERLRMFDDVRFSALLVNDIADIMLKAIDAGLTGLYHLGSRDSMTKYQFGVALAKAAGETGVIEPMSVDDMQFKARRSKNMALDSSELARVLGVRMPSMMEGVERFVDLGDAGYPAALKGAL